MNEFSIDNLHLDHLLTALESNDKEKNDDELALESAIALMGRALYDDACVPNGTNNYADHVDRSVLLELREMFRGSSLRSWGDGAAVWKPLPKEDDGGAMHRCMLVVSGRFKDESSDSAVRRSELQIAAYSQKWKSYSYTTVCKSAPRMFSS